MKDIINSFKASLYERTSSPLIGAFIFYWLVCNYKMIVVIFDDKIDSSKKFLNINDLYMNDSFHGIPLNGLIYPLIATLIYILIFPWISNFIFGIWIYHQNNLKKIGNKKVLTYKEYGDLQRRFTELDLSFDNTFSKKDNEITQLKKLLSEKDGLILNLNKEIETIKERENTLIQEKNNQINSLQSQVHNNKDETINKPVKEKPFEISEIEIRALKIIGNKSSSTNELKSSLNLHKVKIEEIIKILRSKTFIKRDPRYDTIERYIITEQGSSFLLKNNLI